MTKLRLYTHTCLVAFLLGTLALTACSSEKQAPEPPGKVRGDVIDVEQLKQLSLDEVKKYAGDSVKREFLRYGIVCYRLTYKSVYEGDPINTTALLLMPEDSTIERRLCVYMHGTNLPIDPNTAQQQMPSNYFIHSQKSGEVALCAIPLASNGFTVVMPDYIGYGATRNKEHPFIYYPELHYANIDGLRAMCRYLGLKGKQDVRLGGFSQGGGAALSLHYYIQNDYNTEFNVLSSSCLSGPYNYAGQIEGVLRDSIPVPPTLISWSAYVLNRFAVHRNPDQIFAYSVTDQLSALTNFYGGIWDIFRPYFVQGVLSGEDTEWIAASERNSFHKGWKPTGKVYLHHGTADNIVPYFNTIDAYYGLTAEGGDVKVLSYPGRTHLNVTIPYINNTLTLWNEE